MLPFFTNLFVVVCFVLFLCIFFAFYLKFWLWPCSLRQFGSSLPNSASPVHPHFISWKMRAVSTKIMFRQSMDTYQKFLLSQIFASISFMSAFTIMYHIPNQVRLKTLFLFFSILLCFEKNTCFQSNQFPNLAHWPCLRPFDSWRW